jgi:hypothetical protein
MAMLESPADASAIAISSCGASGASFFVFDGMATCGCYNEWWVGSIGGDDEGNLFYVMPYISGGYLDKQN